MTLWIIILLSVLFIFISISVVLYFVQDKIIFHAEKLPQSYKFSFQSEFDEINLKSADGNILNGVLFKIKESKGVLFYLHNHSGNVEHWNRSAIYLNHLNYDVLITDYRGYGKSTGKYNEQFMYDDTKLWYDYLKSNYNEKLITVYGRGIGATFATFIASINNPKQLILEAPLYDL